MKEKMITRTLIQTTGTAMCLNVETAEVSYIEQTIGGEYTPENLLLKFKELFESDYFKVVVITSMESNSITIEMKVSDFIKYGKVVSGK
jgi:hypothetical protein